MSLNSVYDGEKVAVESGRHRDLRTAMMILASVLLVLISLFLLEPQVAVDEEATYESLVKRLFDEVLEGVEDMRGLPQPESTELKIVSIQYFRDKAKEQVRKESEKISLEDIVYRALFMIPQEYSIGEARVEQASAVRSAVAGNRLYIVKENFDPQDTKAARRTLAHEIAHILQSENFRNPKITTSDQRQAWIALVEGDADFTADTYMARSGLFSFTFREAVPGSLDRIKFFPYQYGSGFISALFREGGWSLINSAYQNLPRSTEEVLHPEVFLAGGSFIDVEALTPASNGFEAVFTDTFGEHFIRIMLENGASSNEAAAAAAGWGGDNVTLFNRGESYLVTWRINWDTDEDASEFFEVFDFMVVKMGGEEVEPGLYSLQGHHITFKKHGGVTEIVSSTDKPWVLSVMKLMNP
ncbi:MAG: hypothetical protein V3W09_01480 [Nitrososphaerales archaeon]